MLNISHMEPETFTPKWKGTSSLPSPEIPVFGVGFFLNPWKTNEWQAENSNQFEGDISDIS